MCKTVVKSALPFFLLFIGGGRGGEHGIPAIVISSTEKLHRSTQILTYMALQVMSLTTFPM